MNLSRRNFVTFGSLAAATLALSPTKALSAADQASNAPMGALDAIMTRRSVRAYTEEPVSDAHVDTILKAAMQAPSAYNEQPWEFIVVRNKETMQKVAEINKYALPAKKAPIGILTCINEDLIKHQDQKNYGIIDVSNATMNILLAAHALGLGAVWTGIYPNKELIGPMKDLFKLPKNITPLAFVVMGHVKYPPKHKDHYKPERIRQEIW